MLHRHRRKNSIGGGGQLDPLSDPYVWWAFYSALENTHPFHSREVSLKGGSVRAPPAVSQGVQILQASDLSAKTQKAARVKKKKKKNTTKPHVLDVKGGFYSNCKCFHQFKDASKGAAWGSKRITYAALIKTNAISAYPLRPSVLDGFFCKRWGPKSNSAQFI